MLTTAEAFEKFRKRLELSRHGKQGCGKAPDRSARMHPRRLRYQDGFSFRLLQAAHEDEAAERCRRDVRAGRKEKWRRDKPPIETLQAFEKCLKKKYTETDQIEICRRAVTVEFEKNYYPDDHEGKVLSIDAVPAFECGGDEYEIPDKVTGTWIKTNPEKHKEQATAKNKELDGRWVPLVKMVKGWNRANGKPIKPSFLIEVMAEELVEAPFSTYPNEVRNFFAAMEANIGAVVAGPGRARSACF